VVLKNNEKNRFPFIIFSTFANLIHNTFFNGNYKNI